MKNIFKKTIFAVCLVVFLVILVFPIRFTFAQEENYNFLAPLPCTNDTLGCQDGKLTTFDPITQEGEDSKIGIYLNIMINIFIGICAVLAVIMIILGGIQYMTSELISSKEAGRGRIKNAIFGLLLALGAWLILNTINSKLLDTSLKSLGQQTVEVTADEANFARTERTRTDVGGTAAKTGTLSPGVSDFVANNCSSLNNIMVNTAARQASFCAGTRCVSVPINVGYNGVSEVGQGREGDGKTPKGVWRINGDRRIASGNGAVFSRNGQYNLGSAFINTGATTASGKDRGIGFHGSWNDSMGTTNGCIRMSNENIAALAPCMRTGTTVTIQ